VGSDGVYRVWRTAWHALVGGEAETVTRRGSCSAPSKAAGGGAVAPHQQDSIDVWGRFGAYTPSGTRSGGAKCVARWSYSCQGYDVVASSAQASRSARSGAAMAEGGESRREKEMGKATLEECLDRSLLKRK
jgi:hypothetical protein